MASGLKDSCGNATLSMSYGTNSQDFRSGIHTAPTSVSPLPLSCTERCLYNQRSRTPLSMHRKTRANSAQIVLFPSGETVPIIELEPSANPQEWRAADRTQGQPRAHASVCEVVLSGSFRRDVDGLLRTHEELKDLGCIVLSPSRVEPSFEVDGFVFMKGEEAETPERLELRHLEAIERATFVWLHAPDGYVGVSAALEVGFAHAQGIPVFSPTPIADTTLRGFVQAVTSVAEVLTLVRSHKLAAPAPNLAAFQHYYRRVATQRGYEREDAQNCLLLMVEEVGELARALRKREKLVRHGSTRRLNEADELADVFLYVVHMANILSLDLGTAVREKEQLNIAKFVGSRRLGHGL